MPGNCLTLLPAILRLLLASEAAATAQHPLTNDEPGGMALKTLELNELPGQPARLTDVWVGEVTHMQVSEAQRQAHKAAVKSKYSPIRGVFRT